MATIVSSNATFRIAGPQPNLTVIPITIAGNATAYVQGAGNGLPFDIAALLNSVAQPELFSLNPNDVIGIYAMDALGNYALMGSLITNGAPTYNQQQGMSVQSANTTLITAPYLVRIFAGTTELAAGAYNGTLTGFLFLQRGGHN